MDLLADIVARARATLFDVTPVVAVLLGFQVLVLRRPIAHARKIAAGCLAVLLGLTLFLVGLEEALFPIGRAMALQLTAPEMVGAAGDGGLPDWRAYGWVYAFGGAIGFAASIAEPALIAVALKANHVSGGTVPAFGLRLAVAIGAGVGVALGTLRIVVGTPLPYAVVGLYAVAMLLTLRAPKAIVPLAFDVGGVTTSTVTVPVVAALGLGLASAIPGRSPLVDGFGLIAFTCLCPIISVLAFAGVAERLRRRQSDRTADSRRGPGTRGDETTE